MISLQRCVIYLSFLISSYAMNDFQSNKGDTFASFLSKSWKHCRNVPTISLCFKQRSLLALDNLINSNEAINFPGEVISLIKNKNSVNFSKKFLSEEDLQKYLPKDINVQDKTLDMLLESAYRKFLSSRALQIRFPYNTKEVINEGRGDKKKGNGFAMGAMMAGMMMIPMGLAGVGMLAGKSLMVSMLALMLSALLASRKSHDSGGSSYEVISLPAGGHHHGRRLYTDQGLPYNGHEPPITIT